MHLKNYQLIKKPVSTENDGAAGAAAAGHQCHHALDEDAGDLGNRHDDIDESLHCRLVCRG